MTSGSTKKLTRQSPGAFEVSTKRSRLEQKAVKESGGGFDIHWQCGRRSILQMIELAPGRPYCNFGRTLEYQGYKPVVYWKQLSIHGTTMGTGRVLNHARLVESRKHETSSLDSAEGITDAMGRLRTAGNLERYIHNINETFKHDPGEYFNNRKSCWNSRCIKKSTCSERRPVDDKFALSNVKTCDIISQHGRRFVMVLPGVERFFLVVTCWTG